ncbi:MAG: hypothetical protein REH79_00330 [Spiroplasma sp.]|nr:hypothetical protein [Spiroplasma sp.]
MAENLIDQELLLQEKKKQKKLYKNWKLYASALGIVVIGTGTGLGIYYGVNGNNSSTTPALTEQDFVNAIKNAKYQAEIIQETTVEELAAMINVDFIKDQLSENIKNQFNDQLFKLNQITHANGSKLTNDDLLNAKTIDALIDYNYGVIENQTTNLKIEIAEINDQQIVDVINAKNYKLDIVIKSSAQSVEDLITPEFIKEQLTGAIGAAFNDNSFKLAEISVNSEKLADKNLETKGKINAEINYQYAEITEQRTNLIINIFVSDEQIVEIINETNFSVEYKSSVKVETIKNKITGDFIKSQLKDEQISTGFKTNSFELINITFEDEDEDRDLEDGDLEAIGPVVTKIHYNYGTFKNQNTSLTINLVSTVEPRDLSELFADFKFKDSKNINNFLDSNDQTVIETQILVVLQESSLTDAGLVVEQQTSNSIILKATDKAEDYQGQVTLTWNLKLFEVWGIDTDGGLPPLISDPGNKVELKGYFYLNNQQQIQYFDIYDYFNEGESNEVSRYEQLHTFKFVNEKDEEAIVEFSEFKKTSDIAAQLGSFDLTSKTTVEITSTVYRNVKIYLSNDWIGLDDEITFEIDLSGTLNIKQE